MSLLLDGLVRLVEVLHLLSVLVQLRAFIINSGGSFFGCNSLVNTKLLAACHHGMPWSISSVFQFTHHLTKL
jgi:hypothetical protein